MFIFSDGDSSTTGIDTIDAASSNEANGAYYNLQGQRVEKPQHGVYIHNGKKVVIK